MLPLRAFTGTSDDVVAAHHELSWLPAHTIPAARVSRWAFWLSAPELVAHTCGVTVGAGVAVRDWGEGGHPSCPAAAFRPAPGLTSFPVMLASRLDLVRLLAAAEVGGGRTIETSLIMRALRKRAEARRVPVLRAPCLWHPWQKEPSEKFHIGRVGGGVGVQGPGAAQPAARRDGVRALPRAGNQHRVHQAQALPPPRHRAASRANDRGRGAQGAPDAGQERHLRHGLIQDLAQKWSRRLIFLACSAGVAVSGQGGLQGRGVL